MGTTTAWITQFAFLFVGLAGFVLALAQSDGVDRPIARYRATAMLICALSAGLGLVLPNAFLLFDTSTMWSLSGAGLAFVLLINIGLVAWISGLHLQQFKLNMMDLWIWCFVIVSNSVLFLCLCIVLELQNVYATTSVLTGVFFAAAYWQIVVSGLLFQQVIYERV